MKGGESDNNHKKQNSLVQNLAVFNSDRLKFVLENCFLAYFLETYLVRWFVF